MKTVAGRLEMIQTLTDLKLIDVDEMLWIMEFGTVPTTVEDFMKVKLTDTMIEKYPNAKKANEIKQSKLMKALK